MFGSETAQWLVRFTRLAALILLSLTFTPHDYAQVTSGSILGTVTDPSGGAVANAKIVITNTGTHIRTETLTSAEGHF